MDDVYVQHSWRAGLLDRRPQDNPSCKTKGNKYKYTTGSPTNVNYSICDSVSNDSSKNNYATIFGKEV